MHYTAENVRSSLTMFVKVAQGVVNFLPGDKAHPVRRILEVLSVVVAQDWFVELIAYLLNTFHASEPTKEQLAEALQFFAVEKQSTGIAPPSMKVVGH